MSGNPQMTYYYKIFKRYSHFSMENVSIALDGPNLLSVDSQIQLRAKIQRIGDLMSDMYLSFTIPDIYSKYVQPTGLPKDRNYQYEFQWVKGLGAAIINSVEFFIGGQSIQRFDGTYLYAKSQLEYDSVTLNKWNILVGNTNELANPASGSYQGNSLTGPVYPTVQPQGTGAQTNRPSIVGQDIHVPLNFWFTDATSQALPLIALQYQDCEVVITLNPAQTLYTILDPSGNRVAPQYRTTSTALNNPTYANTVEATGIQNFLTDVGYTVPLTTWPLNARLQCTFVYLSDEERVTFASRPLTYVLPQLRYVPLGPVSISQQTFDLDMVTNPVSRFIFITRRSDWVQRNDFTNFTNWYSFPFAPTNLGTLTGLNTFASGLLIPNSQRDILRYVRVLCNGNEIQEQKPVDFLTKIYPYRYTTGSANAEIPIYSWALTSSKTQPSGCLNASRITNFQLEASFYPLPTNTNYVYNFDLYAELINFLVIVSGSGAPKYVL